MFSTLKNYFLLKIILFQYYTASYLRLSEYNMNIFMAIQMKRIFTIYIQTHYKSNEKLGSYFNIRFHLYKSQKTITEIDILKIAIFSETLIYQINQKVIIY